MTAEVSILRYLGQIKGGFAKEPAGFPAPVMPLLQALYSGWQADNLEFEWGRVGKALIATVPDLGITTWDDVPIARRLSYRLSDMLKLPPPVSVMNNRRGEAVYPDEGAVMLVGQSGSLKSFVTLFHAYDMAREGKRVAIVLFEGFRGYRARIEAHHEHHEIAFDTPWAEHNIVYYDGRALRELPLDLAVPLPNGSLKNIFEPFGESPIDVAFVDTFRQAASIQSENDNSEVGAAIRRAQELATTVVIVHHTRKGDKDVWAGAGAFRDNSDVHIIVSYDKDSKLAKMTCDKSRDHAPFADTYYKVSPVGTSLAISELSHDQTAGVKARAATAKSDRKRLEKDEMYFEMLREKGSLTKVEMANESGESDRTVARWLADAIKRENVEEAELKGKAKTYKLTDRTKAIPF